MGSIHLNIINRGRATIRIKDDGKEKKEENTILEWIKKLASLILD